MSETTTSAPEAVLNEEQQAFIDRLAQFNAESQHPKHKLSPAAKIARRQRANHMAKLAKRLFPGIKVSVS